MRQPTPPSPASSPAMSLQQHHTVQSAHSSSGSSPPQPDLQHLQHLQHQHMLLQLGQQQPQNIRDLVDEDYAYYLINKRIKWTDTLHRKFEVAVNKVISRGRKVTPVAVLKEMNTKYLTRDQIASHLQKYKKENNLTLNEHAIVINDETSDIISRCKKQGDSSNVPVELALSSLTSASPSSSASTSSLQLPSTLPPTISLPTVSPKIEPTNLVHINSHLLPSYNTPNSQINIKFEVPSDITNSNNNASSNPYSQYMLEYSGQQLAGGSSAFNYPFNSVLNYNSRFQYPFPPVTASLPTPSAISSISSISSSPSLLSSSSPALASSYTDSYHNAYNTVQGFNSLPQLPGVTLDLRPANYTC